MSGTNTLNSSLPRRGPRHESRRYWHERTGEPMPAYSVEGFVIEKARRDWDARPYRGSAGNPTRREWWEVRRQGSNMHPGCSIGRVLFEADTLRECLEWVGEIDYTVLSLDAYVDNGGR